MKPFNLEEYLANPSKEVITRDRKPVKILCTNLVSDKPVVAQIDGTGYSLSYPKDGKCSSCQNSMDDLFFASDKHEGWVNLYKSGLGASIWQTEEEAKKWVGAADYVTTIKIEWEE